MRLVKQIETDRRPRDMHFNAAHTLLYVACGDDDVIDVIDVAPLQVVDSIPTGPSPEVFAFSPDESQDLRVERGGFHARDHRRRGQDRDRAYSHRRRAGRRDPSIDGKTVFVTSEVADMVHVIDLASASVAKNIIVGTRPRRFIVTPDGKRALGF